MGDGTGCDNMTAVIVRFRGFAGELKFPAQSADAKEEEEEEEGGGAHSSQKRPAEEEEEEEEEASQGAPPAKRPCSE